jgi:Calcineurin-like phosphoesterase
MRPGRGPQGRASIGRRRARAGAGVLVMALVVAGWAGARVVSAATTVLTTVRASADAYVQSDLPDANAGTATELGARAASTDKAELVSYVKFVVQGLTSAPAGAQLQLYSYAQSSTGVQVWTASSDWTETGITWSTAPPRGSAMVANMANLAVNAYATADVSGVVTADGTYTFAITTTSTLSKKFASREVAATPPQLVLNTSAPGAVTAAAGSGQSTAVGAAFAEPLVAAVADGAGAPVQGVPITFSAPTSGASATFAGGAAAVTVTTDTAGRATTPPLTANATAGSYQVVATGTAVSGSAVFTLINTGAPSSPPPTTAPPTGTVTTRTFKAVADASVRSDQPDANFGGDFVLGAEAASATTPAIVSYLRFPVSGLTGSVTSATLQLYSFATSSQGIAVSAAPATWTETGITYNTAPAVGAVVGRGPNISVNTWAAIDVTPAVSADGALGLVLTTTRTANNKVASRESTATPPTLVVQTVTPGPTPTVAPTPTVPPTGTTNPPTGTTNPPTGTAVRATGGAGQTTMVGTAFASALTAAVTGPDGAPAPGVAVTFTAPAAEPSATFPGGAASVTVTANAGGVATSPPLTAGRRAGTYSVTAATAGAAQPATYGLTNADPTIVAAGDIACPAGKAPTPTSCQQAATSDLALSLHPDRVLPLGDDQYELGSPEDFRSVYGPSWGRLDAIAYPVPGNHEYGYIGSAIEPTGGTGYFGYYGDRSHPLQPGCTSLCKSWYSYDIGSWHVVALDSQCAVVGGCNPGNPEYQWLLADLNAATKPCTLAYWHIPLFSSSQDHQPDMTSIYQLLYTKNADVVLTGHAHFYERFGPQTAAGAADPARGIRQFVIGTGGRNFFGIRDVPSANSEARIANTFGVAQFTLSDGSYSWNFVPTNAGGSTDSGTGTCH